MITLVTCDNLFQAELIKGRLENEGIPSRIINQNISSVLPYSNIIPSMRIQVVVDEKDFAAASEVLRNERSEREAGIIVCPCCSGQNISEEPGRHKFKRMFAIFLSMLSPGPAEVEKKHYYCRDCKKKF